MVASLGLAHDAWEKYRASVSKGQELCLVYARPSLLGGATLAMDG
jgi:hypothetical protein